MNRKITILHTLLGPRELYNSVCYCNRCGLCSSVCPSYQQRPQELFSPRGRNQALRLILEEKIKPAHVQKQLTDMLASCSLCGRCSRQCPGAVPTVEHVLALKRQLEDGFLPNTLLKLLRLRCTHPRVFSSLVKTGLVLRKTGLMHFLAIKKDFAWLRHALAILPKKIPGRVSVHSSKNPNLIYIPSLEAEFLLPNLLAKTYRLAAKKHRPVVWENTASGLAEYVYGDVRRARKWVRQLIIRHSQLNHGRLPVLTDSLEVYYFWRQVPQLFEEYPAFQAKAQRFAKKVCFVTDLLPKRLRKPSQVELPVQGWFTGSFSGEDLPYQTALEILHTLFKKNFVQCEYEEIAVAFPSYGFVKHNHASVYMKQAVQAMSARQVRTVFVASGLAELELAFYLRKFYPTAQACHIVQLNG